MSNSEQDNKNPRERKRAYIMPDSGRKAITLGKSELKIFKKISIDFEVPEDQVLRIAVDLLIQRYLELTQDEIDQKGLSALNTLTPQV